MTTSSDDVIEIRPTKGWAALSLGELWRYREVAFFLAWRDVKVRYKQTVFGASWAIMQPLIQMLVFTLIFGRVAKLPSDGLPYPIFVYAGLLPWTLFANSVNKASNSLVGGGAMLKQVYFSRLAIPLSSVASSLLDFFLAFLVMAALMAYYSVIPTGNIIWLPALVVLALCTALGVSLVLSALNVQFRDVKHVVPFLVQTWMFATPVVYPLSVVDNPNMQMLLALNPMVGVVEGFRWALLGVDTAPGPAVMISAFVAITSIIVGTLYFKRMERTFADVV